MNVSDRIQFVPYFVRDCLGLTPIPELPETLEKADYGERVHRILRAFHPDVPDLPGPFGRPLTPMWKDEPRAAK